MHIVISRYNEDVEWVKNLKCSYTLFNKGEDSIPDSIKLSNVGREAHSYIHYILQNYNNLDNFTLFLQGDPVTHTDSPDIENFLNRLSSFVPEKSFGPIFSTEDYYDTTIVSNNWYKQYPLKTYQIILEGNPNDLSFSKGAQWYAHKYTIQYRSWSWWKFIYDELCKNELHGQSYTINPWTLERLWGYIFNLNIKENSKLAFRTI